jgi:hypothetical protein
MQQQFLSYRAPKNIWGSAITYVKINKDGKMWVGNDEYETQVNYCPFTGTPAPVQMKSIYHKDYKIYNNEQD